MTLREVFDNAIQLLLIEQGDNSPAFIRTRVVSDINAAMQLMSTGIDFFTRETITANITQASPTAELPEDTLNVFGPVRLGGKPLTEIKTRGEFDQFAEIFLGYKTSAPTGVPVAYFVDSTKRVGADNSVKVVMRFTPLPSNPHSAEVEISRRPTAYEVADLSDPSPTIPVPHKMAESILLPIVRWNVRTSHFFNSPEMLPSMEAEFKAALLQLGLSAPPTDKSSTTEDALARKKTAARAAARDAYNATT